MSDQQDSIPDEGLDALPEGAQVLPEASGDVPDEGLSELPPGAQLVEPPVDRVEQGKAFLEGVGQGLVGPIAPMVEKGFGATNESIGKRATDYPWTKGTGEAAGLILPAALTAGASTGARAALELGTVGGLAAKIGEGVVEAAHLGKPFSTVAKVGSAAVRSAAEMAVIQGSDEASKIAYQDQNAPIGVEQAIANVGLGAAVGGAAGGIITGVVSPLFKATIGPELEAMMDAAKWHMNSPPLKAGATAAKDYLDTSVQAGVREGFDSLKDEGSPLSQAMSKLDLSAPATLQAAMHGEPRAIRYMNDLLEGQNPEVMKDVAGFPSRVHDAVLNKMGVSLPEMANYSNADDGQIVRKALLDQYDQIYAPIGKRLDKRDAMAAALEAGQDERKLLGAKVVEQGMDDVGANSEFFPLYQKAAARIEKETTIGGLIKYRTELMRSARSLSENSNAKNAYSSIRNRLNDFIERQLAEKDLTITRDGLVNPAELLKEHQEASEQYKNFATMSDFLQDHMGLGDFMGAAGLRAKLRDLAPEDILKKLSPKGNVQSIPFLQKFFPDAAKALQQSEAKKFLAQSIRMKEGEPVLNLDTLNTKIMNLQKGAPEYANFVMPPDAQETARAGQTILDRFRAMQMRSSKTAGWMTRMARHWPASALAAVGYLSGHNPVASYMIGELAERMGKQIPEAYKLGYLKSMGTDSPANAAAFSKMTTVMANTIKGHKKMMAATAAVLKPGSQVLLSSQMPGKMDRDKLDKVVTEVGENPASIQKYSGQDSNLGYYMPEHQAAVSSATTRQLQYLAGLKPKPQSGGAFGGELPPSPVEQARYNSALDIANNPMLVLQKVKDGTISASDVQDLQSMYPNLYQSMQSNLQNELTNAKASESTVPYKTRLGLSVLLGSPLDNTMQGQSILMNQKAFIKPTQQPQPGAMGKPKRGTATLGKSNKTYQTQSQAAESDTNSRE